MGEECSLFCALLPSWTAVDGLPDKCGWCTGDMIDGQGYQVSNTKHMLS